MTTALIEDSTLTQKQEAFARAFVESGDATAAYKVAYDTSGMQPQSIKAASWSVRHNPKVAARIHSLKGAIASAFVLNEAVLKQAALELADADPAQLQHIRVFCCSLCWSEEQLARDVARYLASAGTTMPAEPPNTFTPDDDPFQPVNPRCWSCMGAGRAVTYVCDTTTLQGAERRLYKGFDIRNDGSVRILMHDQMAAREMAMRAAGVFVTKTESKNLNINANIDSADITPEALAAAWSKQ